MEGHLPPQGIEIEKLVLGVLMHNPQTYYDVQEFFFSELFYLESHMLIAEAIIKLKNESKSIDVYSVVAKLKQMDKLEFVGGAYYISMLTDKVQSASGALLEKVIFLNEYWIKRELITHSTHSIKNAYSNSSDVFDLLGEQEMALNRILNRIMISKTADASECVLELISHIDKIENSNGELIGIPSGFRSIDAITAGWQKTDLVILGARPGMGKTSLMLNFCHTAISNKTPTLVFSLEMSKLQLTARLCSQLTSIPLEKYLKKVMTKDEKLIFNKEAGRLSTLPIYIDDKGGIDIQYIKTKSRKEKRDKKIEFIVIDYLQFIATKESKGKSTNDQISEISRGLKNLAKELEIPIICLSQLSREVEKRPDKRPQNSDLRDSGAIEQDADIIMFIYRPEYYGITDDGNGNSTIGIAEIICTKHRNGATFNEWVGFNGQCTNFYDIKTGNYYEEKTQLEPLTANNDFLS